MAFLLYIILNSSSKFFKWKSYSGHCFRLIDDKILKLRNAENKTFAAAKFLFLLTADMGHVHLKCFLVIIEYFTVILEYTFFLCQFILLHCSTILIEPTCKAVITNRGDVQIHIQEQKKTDIGKYFQCKRQSTVLKGI